MRVLRAIGTTLVSSIVGSVLLTGSILWFGQEGPTQVGAAEPQNVTMNATVSNIAKIQLTTTSVTFPSGAPGSEAVANQALDYVVTHTAPGRWGVELSSTDPDLKASSSSGTIPMSSISWKKVGGDFLPFGWQKTRVVDDTNATPPSGRPESVSFKIIYPETAQAGAYSGTISVALTELQ